MAGEGSEARLVFSGETQALIQQFDRLFNAQERALDRMAELNREGREGKQVAGDLGLSLGDVAGSLGLITSVGGGLSLAVNYAKEWLSYQKQIGEEVRTTGQALAAFALIQEPGTLVDRTKAVARLAADFGVDERSAFEAVQARQSKLGSFEAGMAAARVQFEATQGGIAAEDAEKGMMFGLGAGITPTQAMNLPYIIGQMSPMSPADVIKAAPALSMFGGRGIEDATQAYAVAGVLSERVPIDRLFTATERAGTHFNLDSGVTGEAFAKLGLGRDAMLARGVSESNIDVERMRALVNRGVTSQSQLAKLGFDTETSQTLARVLEGVASGQFDQYMRGVQADMNTEGYIMAQRRAAEAEMTAGGMPNLAMSRRVEASQAAQQVDRAMLNPRQVRSGSIKALNDQIRALELQGHGYGWLVGDDNEASAFTAAIAGIPEQHVQARMAARSVDDPIRVQWEALTALRDEIAGLRSDLRDNSDATRENSGSAGSGAAVMGQGNNAPYLGR